ncbi:uncharacterized protein LOC127854720 [Dreissena polymorpha]|uniref:VWFA domain-containing protein n=1 Tax=Dreissena polymorpha TaxID=45954 RepID=A0A9D4CBG2_DREPO|nr:uncharacterized protein LOC127854720 [Dreissena polymorpha]KAH3721028.1 hypothetical protein DPMN_063941 [Dreissena polymorpha]
MDLRKFVWIYSLLCMGRGVFGVDGDVCKDIDTQACVLMAQRNPALCQDQVLSQTACPKFCKICPLECYHCEVAVRDYMDCNTTAACDVNQQCILQKLHSSRDGHDEYVMGCASLQLCDGIGLSLAFGRRTLHERNVALTCCDTDRCNLPTQSSTVPNTFTVPNIITQITTQHVPSCVKDIVLIVEDFGSRHTGVENSTPYVTAFLKELVARIPIGQTDSLLELSLIDSDITSVWSLTDHVSNYSLQSAINGIPFQQRTDHLDINDLVNFLSRQAFTITTGNRPNVPNVVVIFVDQQARPNTVAGLDFEAHTVQRVSGDIIVVNIGLHQHSAMAQIATLLATDANHVLSVKGYDALHGIKDTLVNLICN